MLLTEGNVTVSTDRWQWIVTEGSRSHYYRNPFGLHVGIPASAPGIRFQVGEVVDALEGAIAALPDQPAPLVDKPWSSGRNKWQHVLFRETSNGANREEGFYDTLRALWMAHMHTSVRLAATPADALAKIATLSRAAGGAAEATRPDGLGLQASNASNAVFAAHSAP